MFSPRLQLFQNFASSAKSAKILAKCVISCTFFDEDDESKGSTGGGDNGGNGIVADRIADLLSNCLAGFRCFLVVM